MKVKDNAGNDAVETNATSRPSPLSCNPAETTAGCKSRLALRRLQAKATLIYFLPLKRPPPCPSGSVLMLEIVDSVLGEMASCDGELQDSSGTRRG